MTKQELYKAKDLIKKVLDDLRPELMQNFGNIEFEEKEDNSPLTALDLKVEEVLKEALNKEFPDIGFSGEETGTDYDQETFWLVDPIDGTISYVRGLVYCTNMICLIDNGEPVLAVINAFVENKFYWAIKGEGAFCNEQSISVSNRSGRSAVIYIESKAISETEGFYPNMLAKWPLTNEHAFASGYFYTTVAEGKVEGRVNYKPFGYPYDFAPGSLLVREAGGVVRNVGKNDYNYLELDSFASNTEIADELGDFLVKSEADHNSNE